MDEPDAGEEFDELDENGDLDHIVVLAYDFAQAGADVGGLDSDVGGDSD